MVSIKKVTKKSKTKAAKNQSKAHVVVWPYMPAQKREIIEDATSNNSTLLFCNGDAANAYEFISAELREFSPSLANFLKDVKEENVHILYHDSKVKKKIIDVLKHNKISFIEKDKFYPI